MEPPMIKARRRCFLIRSPPAIPIANVPPQDDAAARFAPLEVRAG
jgi:hypothetical protein